MTATTPVGVNDTLVQRRSAVAVTASLAVALAFGMQVPLFLWFAVGAASGYSLSGSV